MTAGRRVDLDWIRILAFASLILYHVGMYYVTWDYHVKSPFFSPTIEPLMLLVNPWRLALLFLVSGAATAFIATRLHPGQLAESRSLRLLRLFGRFRPAIYEIAKRIAWLRPLFGLKTALSSP